MEKDKYIKNLIIILLLLMIILIYSKINYIFQPFFDIFKVLIMPLIIGGFIYYWLRPITRWLSRTRLKKFKSLYSALAILLFLSIFIVVISLSANLIKDQLTDTYSKLEAQGDYLESLEENLKKIKLDSLDLSPYKDRLKEVLSHWGKNLPSLFSGIGDFGTQLLLLPFMVYYLLRDEEKIKSTVLAAVAEKHRQDFGRLLKRLDRTLSSYIIGQLLVAMIIGALMFIGYLILGLPNAFLMASFSLITSIIPMIGAFLGIIPALILALTIDLRLFFKIIVLSVIVQQLEGDLITPHLMGSKLKIHPFVIMLVIIISINLMGIMGAFIGIPVYLSASIIIKELVELRRRGSEQESN